VARPVEITVVVEQVGWGRERLEIKVEIAPSVPAAGSQILPSRLYNHPSMTVKVRSFAKINFGLRIGAARDDGFHELLTVYQTIGLHDLIRVSVGRGKGIEIRCADPRVPQGDSNTCFRIVERAMRALGAKGRVTIDIEKRLPVQGGLGGASANAVSALLGIERALKKTLTAAEKFEMAAEVGSDLPLFLVGGTVLGVGRGEQVYPLPDLPRLWYVIVTPGVGVSTPNAFAEWDRSCGASPRDEHTPSRDGQSAVQRAEGVSGKPPTDLRSVRADQGSGPPEPMPAHAPPKLTVSATSDRMKKLGRGLSAWLSETYSGAPFGRGRAENPLLELVRAGIENDFERVVFPEYPELREGKRALVRAGAKYASLSGSGSTLYGLFRSRAAAVRAVIRLRKQGWAAQATTTVTRQAYWSRIFD
jgi:4-diphosphocytidyl-2-C-methyl-D-erythritol kinase